MDKGIYGRYEAWPYVASREIFASILDENETGIEACFLGRDIGRTWKMARLIHDRRIETVAEVRGRRRRRKTEGIPTSKREASTTPWSALSSPLAPYLKEILPCPTLTYFSKKPFYFLPYLQYPFGPSFPILDRHGRMETENLSEKECEHKGSSCIHLDVLFFFLIK